MNLLNDGVVQNEWKGACTGRTGNVRFSPTASQHTCEDNTINRWHCTLSRLEYALRNKKVSEYVAPDAVNYPALATAVLAQLVEQSQGSALPQPVPLSTLDHLLRLEDPSQRYNTVEGYIMDLHTGAAPIDSVQVMGVVERTDQLLTACTTEQINVLRTRLVRWCRSVFRLNPKVRHNVEKWNRDKDIRVAILNLVHTLVKKEKA